MLAFLLLGPIVKQVNNIFEKPFFILLYDNSVSVREAVDSTSLSRVGNSMTEVVTVLKDKGYEVKINNLAGEDIENPTYNAETSDLTGALKKIANRYEGSRMGGVVLVSDQMEKVVSALVLGRASHRKMKQNIMIAVAANEIPIATA